MKTYEMLELTYVFGGIEQKLFPVVLFGARDAILVDCGYPGSLGQLEEQLYHCGVEPAQLTGLVLTHQDDDHMGAAAELQERYPGIRIFASQAEEPYLSGKQKNLRLV